MITHTSGKPHPSSLVIPTGRVQLQGDLVLPASATGIVLFVHGSGSSRFSSRNRYVAGELAKSGLATLLIDLLTTQEEAIDRETAHLRFDIKMLSDRVIDIIDWLSKKENTRKLNIGLFGASTGAAAALLAARKRDQLVKAIVSRGGRPDLAEECLNDVKPPTLLIVGDQDRTVLRLNIEAADLMSCTKKLAVVHGATHLFEEPGMLEQVAMLARDWFCRYLK